eukprot:75081_1
MRNGKDISEIYLLILKSRHSRPWHRETSLFLFTWDIVMKSNKKKRHHSQMIVTESPFTFASSRKKRKLNSNLKQKQENSKTSQISNKNSNSQSIVSTDVLSTPTKQKPRKSRKNDGSTKKGTYDKGKPHSRSWAKMAESQKDSVKAILPKLKEIGETLVCGLCKFHRVGGKMGNTGVSIYSLASSKKKLKEHKARDLHKKAIGMEQKLQEDNLRVFQQKMKQKKQLEKDREMLPLIALAFWIANNTVAIRKYLSLRKNLLPSIIKCMVQTFKETFDKNVVRNMNGLADKYRRKLRELRSDGLIKNDAVIRATEEFLADIEKSYAKLRDVLNDAADPKVTEYIKNQSHFTEIIQCIALVRR